MQMFIGVAAIIVSGLIGYCYDTRIPLTVLSMAVALAGGVTIITSHRGLSARRGGSPQSTLVLLFGLKYLAVTLLVYGHWQHYLSQSADILVGYDPQRYFFDAKAWADVGFDRNFTPANGYLGAIAAYGVLFTIVGWSPMVAAAFNVCLSFVAMYRLSGLVVVVSKGQVSRCAVLGCLLAVPDLLWYDCLTGRESLLTSSLTLLAVSCAGYASARGPSTVIVTLLWSCFWLGLVGLVRTSMAIPGILFGTVCAWLPFPAGSYKKALSLVVILVVTLVGAAGVSELLGSQVSLGSIGPDQLIGRGIDREPYYTEASITRMLATDNIAVHFLYSPIRAVFYMINGVHNLYYDWARVMDPRGAYLQTVASFLTALFNIIVLPLLALVAIESFRDQKNRQWRMLTVPFMLTIMAVACGTQIVHERYRVPALPFAVAMLFLSPALQTRQIRLAYAIYLGAAPVLIGTIIYLKRTLH